MNEQGIAAVRNTAEALGAVPFERCYSSPLIRARQTAEIMTAGRPIEICLDDRLQELNFGALEGCLIEQALREKEGELLHFYRDPKAFQPSGGGESLADLEKRCLLFLDTVLRPLEKCCGCVLVTAHGALIRQMTLLASGESQDVFWGGKRLKNAAVSVMNLSDGILTLEREAAVYYQEAEPPHEEPDGGTPNYCYETHCHTGEFGWCAKVPAARLIDDYARAGFRGVCVTNHYFNRGFEAMPECTWEGKIQRYLRGYRNACLRAERYDMDILLGLEIRLAGCSNDYLVYGVDEALLLEYPRLYELDLEGWRRFTQVHGLCVVQAHPCREFNTPVVSDFVDGFEVYNACPRHDSHNDAAREWAESQGGLQTAGSDCHRLEDVARAGVGFSSRVRSSRELADKMLLAQSRGLSRDWTLWLPDKRAGSPLP